jgi:hypothetical protein
VQEAMRRRIVGTQSLGEKNRRNKNVMSRKIGFTENHKKKDGIHRKP